MSYDDDMTATAAELSELLERVNEATKLLQRSETVPQEVAELVDSFEPELWAAAPLRLQADPYLTTQLWAAAFRAEKALRHDSAEARRREVRIALEQARHALRDMVANQPYGDDAPVRDVLARTVDRLALPQREVADVLGVSVRQLQRWLAPNGPDPTSDDAARIRALGQVVNQLRHVFTGPGVLAWFDREHPVLNARPVELLGDPLRFPQLISAAAAARAMAG
jgi:hypothetical protein